ncbi:MAG: cobalt-zinc-cadmium efflux system membrane fusion protein [Maricaulis maris]|jgi:cobalt-zinc-cadmium efflux system membrane fusion protein
MTRNIFAATLCGSTVLLLIGCSPSAPDASGGTDHGEVATEDYERGPHRGRMLRQGEFALELTIFEDGVDPQFRLFPYLNGQPVDPSRVDATIELTRLGGHIDHFAFAPQEDFLRGDGVVTEPHSFDVAVTASMPGVSGRWQYQSYEGRTTISSEQAEAGGIAVSVTGPATLDETVEVYGEIELVPEGRAELRGWLPGRVVALNASIGDRVEAGQTLARITATDSLQTYSVTSPISGVVVERGATLNGPTGSEPLFVVADPSQLHAELFIYPGDLGSVATGQPVHVTSFGGGRSVESEIEFLSPMVDPASQRAIAHVEIPNEDGQWRPGERIRARIEVGQFDVPLAVRTDALQRFRDFTVVYARVDDTYEVRMLELGRQTPEWTEVLGGIDPGVTYVSENAFLITADVMKSGASHDH